MGNKEQETAMYDQPDNSHEWQNITFIYESWVECTCGFKPYGTDEMAEHELENGMNNTKAN